MVKRQKIGQKREKKLKDRLNRHICNHYHKHFHVAHHTHHLATHMGELVLVLLVGCMSWMFAGSVGLPNNTSFSYPLQQVSTLECRTQYREDMDLGCKINLPHISNANYAQYAQGSIQRQIYSVLWAAPYKESWNQNIGAHDGLDIASARGTPLYSIGDGEIVYAGRQNGYGNVVKIKYLFQGKYIYAVYGHMDSIETEAGKKVSAGQRIGTVGNSGTTFGALGGFHVHFEIDKDNGGRPMYAFLDCPDLGKGTYTIIQEGLCREQLLLHQYDPIVLFEQNRLGNVIQENIAIPDRIQEPTSTVDTNIGEEEKTPISFPEKTPVPFPEKAEPQEVITTTTQQENTIPTEQEQTDIKDTSAQEVVHDVAPVQDNSITKQEDQEQLDSIPETNHTTVQEDNNITTVQTENGTGRIGEKVEIDTTDFPDEIKHFFAIHELYIDNHTGSNIIPIGERKTIEINFYKKGSDTKFVGILPFSLDLIASQTNIVTDYSVLQLISPNPTKINIQGAASGTSVLILSIDNITIYKIPYTIK